MTRYQNPAGHPDSTGIRVRKTTKAQRLALTADLIVKRMTYEEIAARVGVSRRQVIRYSKELMAGWAEEHFPEDRHRWRLQELQRLAAMENAITEIILNEQEPEAIDEEGYSTGFIRPYSTEAQLKAVGRALQIMQRRAALLGLDLPKEGAADSPPQIGKVIIHVHEDRLPLRQDQLSGGNGDGEVIEGSFADKEGTFAEPGGFESYHYDIEEDIDPEDEDEDEEDE